MPLNPATNATFEVLQGLFLDLTGGVRGSGLFFEVLAAYSLVILTLTLHLEHHALGRRRGRHLMLV